jgi:hypothetical protein
MTALTWQAHTDSLFGAAYALHGLREGESGGARRTGDDAKGRARYAADAWIGGRYLCHTAGTMRAAMTRLEREIDRLSIGLFGDDVVTFCVK